MNTEVVQASRDAEIKAGIRKRLIQLGAQTLFLAAVLVVSSGRLDWVAAWVYLGLFVFGLAVNGYVLYRKNPELIAERAEVRGGRPRAGIRWSASVSFLPAWVSYWSLG